jgi:ketosteroid isomerase-like protein
LRRRSAVLAFAAVLSACASGPRTPEEFVAQYVEAYRAKDAEAVLAMTLDATNLPRPAGKPDLPKEALAYDRVQERAELEREMAQNGMSVRVWVEAVYRSAREHGDHFHVEVQMPVGRNTVVLVRQTDGTLKLHPRPMWID